jgi:hypothetical protein
MALPASPFQALSSQLSWHATSPAIRVSWAVVPAQCCFSSAGNAHELQVSSSKQSADTLWIHYATFIVLGMLLGGFSLWILPILLDTHVAFDKSLFGEHIFTFMVYIFVNVHHYFLDNVIWRKDNPEISKHLFGAT